LAVSTNRSPRWIRNMIAGVGGRGGLSDAVQDGLV
jgi:hypothetical protein